MRGLFVQALVVLDLLFQIDIGFSSALGSLLWIASRACKPISSKISLFVNHCSRVKTEPQPS